MTFNPNELLQSYSAKGGFARNAHYRAWFAANPELAFSITNINLPGRSIVTDTFQFAPELPIVRPITTSYSPVSFTALLDGDGTILSSLRGQLERIVETTNNTFKVAYPENYESELIIETYRNDGQKTSQITLQQAYILQLGDVQLGWGDDGISTVSVAMQYRKWIEG